ncbi:hypothetical protein Baya_16028 [Bagarius yarrelli]|uniref:Uncharacterized protein n=1 Tax=Bagarius yarrelli TaxID=175774 RepID=A0A556VU44_BAGYA|nr:hypothetical protein Baya_16028 [Bagarius yarrelli]
MWEEHFDRPNARIIFSNRGTQERQTAEHLQLPKPLTEVQQLKEWRDMTESERGKEEEKQENREEEDEEEKEDAEEDNEEEDRETMMRRKKRRMRKYERKQHRPQDVVLAELADSEIRLMMAKQLLSQNTNMT